MDKKTLLLKILYYLLFYIVIISWSLFFIIGLGCLIFHYSDLIPTIFGIVAWIASLFLIILMCIAEKKNIIVKKEKKKIVQPDVYVSPYKTYEHFFKDFSKSMKQHNFELKKSDKDLSLYIKTYHNDCYSIIVTHHTKSFNSKNKEVAIDKMVDFYNSIMKETKVGGLEITFVICTDDGGQVLKELISEKRIVFERAYTHKAIIGLSIKDNELYLSKNYEPLVKGLSKKIEKQLKNKYKRKTN